MHLQFEFIFVLNLLQPIVQNIFIKLYTDYNIDIEKRFLKLNKNKVTLKLQKKIISPIYI